MNNIHIQHQILKSNKEYEETTGRNARKQPSKGQLYIDYLEQSDVFFVFAEGTFNVFKNRPGAISRGILTVEWEFVEKLINGNDIKVAVTDKSRHVLDSNFEPVHWIQDK